MQINNSIGFPEGVYHYTAGEEKTHHLIPTVKIPIGEGSCGIVYPHKKYPEQLIVKIAKALIDENSYEDFIPEYRVGRMLSHPNFARIPALFVKHYPNCEKHKLVGERIHGQTLLQLRKASSIFSLDQMDVLFQQIRDSCCYLYNRKISWADMHDENVMITNDRIHFFDYGNWGIHSTDQGEWVTEEDSQTCTFLLLSESETLLKDILSVSVLSNFRDRLIETITTPPRYSTKELMMKVTEVKEDEKRLQIIFNYFEAARQQLYFSYKSLCSPMPLIPFPKTSSLGDVYEHVTNKHILVVLGDDVNCLYNVGAQFDHPQLIRPLDLKIITKVENDLPTFAVTIEKFYYIPLENGFRKLSSQALLSLLKQAKSCCCYLYEHNVVWANLQIHNLFISMNNTLTLGNYRGWYFENNPTERSKKLIFNASELMYNLIIHSFLSDKPSEEIRAIVNPETFLIESSQLDLSSSDHNYPSVKLEGLIIDYFNQVIRKIANYSINNIFV